MPKSKEEFLLYTIASLSFDLLSSFFNDFNVFQGHKKIMQFKISYTQEKNNNLGWNRLKKVNMR